jgi:hypothetical protein
LRAPTLTLGSNGAHASGGAGGAGGNGAAASTVMGGTGAMFSAGNEAGMNGQPGTLDNSCGGPAGGCWVAGGGGGRGGSSGFAGRISQGAN